MPYYFEKDQKIKVEVFDEDKNVKDDLIGTHECSINLLLTAPDQTLKQELVMPNQEKKEKRGKIILKADAVSGTNHEFKVDVSFSVNTLEKKGFLCFCKGYHDRPYLTVSR